MYILYFPNFSMFSCWLNPYITTCTGNSKYSQLPMYLKTRQYRTCYSTLSFASVSQEHFLSWIIISIIVEKIFFTQLSKFDQSALRFFDELNVFPNTVDLASVILDYNFYCK